MERLQGWMFERDMLKVYKETRNGMLGADYSSKFSPWLACGCLSPRTVYWSAKKYEKQRVANQSTYWLIFELLWRDYFRFQGARLQGKLFLPEGEGLVTQEWVEDDAGFQAWAEGNTGWPLVDANMREMRATGFMSNRGRQNVASFLALDLRVDWRKGASVFEEFLLDYDPASNWGNWAAAAGLGGGRVNRFNITKQSKDYDADGKYVKHWCPELKNVPNSYVHEPWRMPEQVQKSSGCRVGVDYPAPVQTRFAPPEGNRGGGKGKGKGKGKGGGGKGGGYNPRGGDPTQPSVKSYWAEKTTGNDVEEHKPRAKRWKA